jgi:ABC-type phosphate transport system ATPase subunit
MVKNNSLIILLDEVTKSIVVDSRRFVNEVINELKKDKTIIIVTHYINEVERDSNKIYLNQENRRENHNYRPADVSMSNVVSS